MCYIIYILCAALICYLLYRNVGAIEYFQNSIICVLASLSFFLSLRSIVFSGYIGRTIVNLSSCKYFSLYHSLSDSFIIVYENRSVRTYRFFLSCLGRFIVVMVLHILLGISDTVY